MAATGATHRGVFADGKPHGWGVATDDGVEFAKLRSHVASLPPCDKAIRQVVADACSQSADEIDPALLKAAKRPLDAANKKQEAKRVQLAECLQEIERLRKEDARAAGRTHRSCRRWPLSAPPGGSGTRRIACWSWLLSQPAS